MLLGNDPVKWAKNAVNIASYIAWFNYCNAISDIQSDNTYLRTPGLSKRLLQPVTGKGVPKCAGFHAIVSLNVMINFCSVVVLDSLDIIQIYQLCF